MACPMLSHRSHLVGRQAAPPHGKVDAVAYDRICLVVLVQLRHQACRWELERGV